MADTPVRVALLARAGEAREQLRRALQELGASIVAEGDPNELDPAQVKAQSPSVVLVSLEPTVEDALDRFADLLAMPNVEVMYDDADVTSKLEGWDLARWARHLAAKLVGSDLLPPAPVAGAGGAEEEVMISPGLPPTPAQLMDDAKLEDYTLDTAAMAEGVPSTDTLTDLPGGMAEDLGDTDLPLPSVGFDLDLGDVEQALSRMDAETGGKLPTAGDDAEAVAGMENLDEFNMDLDLGQLNAMLGKEEPPASKPGEPLPPTLADLDFDSDTPTKFSNFGGGDEGGELALDDDLAALAAAMDANTAESTREEVKDPDFAIAFEKEPEDTPAPSGKPDPASSKASFSRNEPPPPKKVAKPSFDLSGLSLEEMNDNPAVNKAQIEAQKNPSGLLDKVNFSLESMVEETEADSTPAAKTAPAAKPAAPAAAVPPPTILSNSSLSLEALDDESAGIAAATVPGALLVLAGMGGPDAVRQLLGSLPKNLPVPVLLYQHLEVGKHDRLVGQLAKVSVLPVYLAEDGKPVRPGQVAVLSAGMGVDKGVHHFAPALSLAALINAMPAADSALIVLSGADAGVAHAAKTMHSHGGIVHAQEPASCFEPAAAQALTEAGILAYAPGDLASHACKRWM